MEGLEEIVGTIMTSLTRARRMADEHTAALAEHYRATPELRGMSLPRIRVPEMVVDLPVLLKSQETSESRKPLPLHIVRSKIMRLFEQLALAKPSPMPREAIDQFEDCLDSKLKGSGKENATVGSDAKIDARDHSINAAMRAFEEVFEGESAKRISRAWGRGEDQKKRLGIIKNALKKRLRTLTTERLAPPRLVASAVTANIKDYSGPESVARLKITLREEGMEWGVAVDDQGISRPTLIPE